MARENKIPRKLKKALRNNVISVDLATIPAGWDLKQYIDVFHKTGFLFYDSAKIKNGHKPQLILKRKGKKIRLKPINNGH